MALNRVGPRRASSASGGFVDLYPLPVITNRAPTVNDRAEIGTIWIDQTGNDVYILMEIVAANATWTPIGAGAGVFDSVTSTTFVNAGTSMLAGTTVTAGTGLIATTGGVTCSDWTYGTVVSGVAGVLTSQALTNGQVLIGSTGAAPVAAAITAGAGIAVANGAGTITITATGATAVQYTCDDANVVVPDGVGNVNVVGGVNCASVGAVANTITINVDAAPTFAGLVTCQLGIDVGGANAVIASATNAGNDIYLHANGGVAETINIHADQGTGVDSITVQSDVGGLTMTSGLAAADAINIDATAGGLDIDAAMQINIQGDQNATDAIVINATAGGIDITSAGLGAGNEDIDITTTSSINLVATEDAAQSIYLHANGGTTETIDIHSDQGTTATSINVHSDVGGLTLTSGLGSTDAINITATDAAGGIDVDSGTGGFDLLTTGGISIDSSLASNFTVANAGENLTLQSTLGSVLIYSGEDTAQNIYLHSNGATNDTLQLHADTGTGVTSIYLLSDVGGMTLEATGLASDDAINLTATAGGIDVDAAMHIDIQTTEDQNDAMQIITTQGGIDITAQGADAGDDIDITSARVINLVSTGDLDPAIYLHANGGTNEVIELHSDQGTGADSIQLTSDVGGITLTATGLASDDAINLEATAGGIDIDAALHIDIQTTEDQNDAMQIIATQGGIDITAQGTDAGDDIDITSAREINIVSTLDGAESIYLHANGGTNESIDLHSDQGTGADSIQLSSDVGGITMTATGLASDDAINLEAVAGGIDIDAGMHIDIQSAEDQNDAIQVITTAGGIDITAQGTDVGDDIDITSARAVNVVSTGDIAQAIYLHANAGTTETIQLHADQGTDVASIYVLSDVGGITLEATGLASDDAINLTATAGGVDIDGAMQVNIASSEAQADALVITTSAGGIDIAAIGGAGMDVDISSQGAVNLTTTENAAQAVYIHANGGANETIDVHADQGTADTSINIHSDVGGITLDGNTGNVIIVPAATTIASPTVAATLNVNEGCLTATGFTTASAATETFTITNDNVSVTSAILATCSNEGGNDAQMTVTRINRAAGSFVVTLTNNGAQALNGNLSITFMVMS